MAAKLARFVGSAHGISEANAAQDSKSLTDPDAYFWRIAATWLPLLMLDSTLLLRCIGFDLSGSGGEGSKGLEDVIASASSSRLDRLPFSSLSGLGPADAESRFIIGGGKMGL